MRITELAEWSIGWIKNSSTGMRNLYFVLEKGGRSKPRWFAVVKLAKAVVWQTGREYAPARDDKLSFDCMERAGLG